MMRSKPVIVFLLLICTSACGDPQIDEPVIEDTGMVGVMGFDYVDGKKTRVSVTLPQPHQTAEENVQMYSTDVRLPHQAILDVSLLTEKTLTTSQLRVVLFSEEFARKQGLWNILENLYRDPNVGTNVFVAVVKGSVEEALKTPFKDKPEINTYLNELLTPRSITSFSPFTTIRTFIYRNTDNVSDPTTPYIEIVNNNSLKISKVALFKGDKMVDTIDREEGKLVEALKKRRKLADITLEIPSEEHQESDMVILKFVGTRFNRKVGGNIETPELFIHLYVRGSIVDYDGIKDLEILENRENIEEEIARKLEERLTNMIAHFKKIGVDPIGFGESFRIRYPQNWSKEKWLEMFERTNVTNQVEVRIVSTGTIR